MDSKKSQIYNLVQANTENRSHRGGGNPKSSFNLTCKNSTFLQDNFILKEEKSVGILDKKEKSVGILDKEEKSVGILEQCAPIALGDEYAHGSFGSVHIVDTPTGQVAVKRVPQLVDHVNRELDICKQLASNPHPSIVKLLGYWIESTPSTLYLVMEFMPETLGSILENLAKNSMRMKIYRMIALMSQLASSLDYLEQIHLMHRDLKPDNILINIQTNRLVLADFGSAKFWEHGKPNATYVCTRFYRAPCLILNRDMYSTSCDIWSFGCILAEFAYGGPLFRADTQIDIMTKIIKLIGMVTIDDIAHMLILHPETIDLDVVGLSCTRKPWSKVFTIRHEGKRINTSYGESYERILDACLKWNPSSRISAYDLFRDPFWNKSSK